MGSDKELIVRLRQLARATRRRNLRLIHEAGLGHIGADLSATDILTVLHGSPEPGRRGRAPRRQEVYRCVTCLVES